MIARYQIGALGVKESRNGAASKAHVHGIYPGITGALLSLFCFCFSLLAAFDGLEISMMLDLSLVMRIALKFERYNKNLQNVRFECLTSSPVLDQYLGCGDAGHMASVLLCARDCLRKLGLPLNPRRTAH